MYMAMIGGVGGIYCIRSGEAPAFHVTDRKSVV